jgi:Putative transposase/Transposase zinc-binding domain
MELAELLRAHGQAYLAAHALSRAQAKAWRGIVACRTEALGGHVERCSACAATRQVYHSCRNRHCPKCQIRAKEQWIAARQRELLPVPYFHLVFTLPHALNPLAGAQARALYAALFESVSGTLTEFGANARWLGGALAFTLVLHTWAQNLTRHLHVHALVAGGALNAQSSWVCSRRGFLFPVKALSRVFRGKFIAAIQTQREQGRFGNQTHFTDAAWCELIGELRRHDWVVYAKQPLGGPAQVLDYLARYTHRVAISNERILGLDRGQVAFRVRAGPHGERKRVEHLAAETFIGRFLQHVLPPGFKRIRHYGLLANAHKSEKLAACRVAFQLPEPDAPLIENLDAFMRRVAQIDITACPHCRIGRLQLIAAIAPIRPDWHPRLATGPPRR